MGVNIVKVRPRACPQLTNDFVDAAHHEPAVAIELLSKNPSLAEATSTWGETALQAASHLGHHHLLLRLLELGVMPDLFAACALGDRRLAFAMLRGVRYRGRGAHGLPTLHFGIMSRDVRMVEMLIEAGVPVNPPGASLPPLHSAVAIRSAQIVRVLLTAGADIDALDVFGATAADWADEFDQVHVLADLDAWRNGRLGSDRAPRARSGINQIA